MAEIVVVDTNVIITALISGSPFVVDKLADPKVELVAPKFIVVELFKHSPRIQKATSLVGDDVLDMLSCVVECITLYDESDISVGSWAEAYRLIGKIDEKDTPFVALALELNARLWTNDRPLVLGLRRAGFLKFYP